ncbi:hypothetical protein ABZ260_08120 [Streptosporangium sp. NPDC006013]|uniref:hypothetical protein n=1 Tax=Streptosporangium sp. NPDC006013 TaxID=3155596 RepID=UPI0033BF4A95
MKIRGVGVLLIAPLLAACGAGPSSDRPDTPTAGPSSALAVYQELVACIRRHGVPNLPDPVVDAQGEVQVNTTAQIPAAARTACASIAERLPAGAGKGPVYSAADMAQLRRLAQCFRDHGIADWPDPNARGEFPLPQRLRDLGKRGWRDQLPACRQYFVGKSLLVTTDSGNNG